jgi:hypothetical protein
MQVTEVEGRGAQQTSLVPRPSSPFLKFKFYKIDFPRF